MSADFNKNEFSHQQKIPEHLNDVLAGRFSRLRYEAIDEDYYNQRGENLKKYNDLHIKKEMKDFDKAKERIKQKIISSDNSNDNSFVYTAMAQFKQNKEYDKGNK